jgi:hypothetical protein
MRGSARPLKTFRAYMPLSLSQGKRVKGREVSRVKIQTMVSVPAVNVTKSA